jgi:hypothetical protein
MSEKEVQSRSRAEEATGSSERIVRYANCARTGTADRGDQVVWRTWGGYVRTAALATVKEARDKVGLEALELTNDLFATHRVAIKEPR